MKQLSIQCCACGVELPAEVLTAIELEEERREVEEMPTIGLVCAKCEDYLEEDYAPN